MGAQKQNFIIEWGLVIFDVAHVFPPHSDVEFAGIFPRFHLVELRRKGGEHVRVLETMGQQTPGTPH